MTGGAGIEHPRGGQFGRGIEHPCDDQTNSKIAFALWHAMRQQSREIDAPSGGYRSKHMAVRKRADDLHGIGGRQQPLAAQYGAELLDAFGGPMREVCQRSGFGVAGFAVAFTQQDRWR